MDGERERVSPATIAGLFLREATVVVQRGCRLSRRRLVRMRTGLCLEFAFGYKSIWYLVKFIGENRYFLTCEYFIDSMII